MSMLGWFIRLIIRLSTHQSVMLPKMGFAITVIITSLIIGLGQGLLITYPTTGTIIDASKPFSITWTSNADDPSTGDDLPRTRTATIDAVIPGN
ncbi:hypothetical protein VTN77DRAFT_3109 [Rasamsonia byssochlamydoides]|uniref:uncharacterized protein n=1 Tax=Rasamsonia byssochlamydoides TaxID=89139 RepID=UPI003742F086